MVPTMLTLGGRSARIFVYRSRSDGRFPARGDIPTTLLVKLGGIEPPPPVPKTGMIPFHYSLINGRHGPGTAPQVGSFLSEPTAGLPCHPYDHQHPDGRAEMSLHIPRKNRPVPSATRTWFWLCEPGPRVV